MSSIYMMFRVCMSVCLSYKTACNLAHMYVHTVRTEEYQSVGNKQAKKQQQMCVLEVLFTSSWSPDTYV